METSPTLYLIAHRVRGIAAFDIAIRCDDTGTENDPGPWWLIPTSGHRAYPYWTYRLADLFAYQNVGDPPDEVPDHYQLAAAPKGQGQHSAADLAAALGIGKPKILIERRI